MSKIATPKQNLSYAFFSRPGPQAEQGSGADQPVGWAGLCRFFGFWRGGDIGRRIADCGHITTKPGVSKGGGNGTPWHTTLPARCSVLYLLARLTGEAGGGAVCAPLALAGKRAVVLWPGGNKTIVRFQ